MITESEERVIREIKDISHKGKCAEVKVDKDGKWTIYEVQKKKREVGPREVR